MLIIYYICYLFVKSMLTNKLNNPKLMKNFLDMHYPELMFYGIIMIIGGYLYALS